MGGACGTGTGGGSEMAGACVVDGTSRFTVGGVVGTGEGAGNGTGGGGAGIGGAGTGGAGTGGAGIGGAGVGGAGAGGIGAGGAGTGGGTGTGGAGGGGAIGAGTGGGGDGACGASGRGGASGAVGFGGASLGFGTAARGPPPGSNTIETPGGVSSLLDGPCCRMTSTISTIAPACSNTETSTGTRRRPRRGGIDSNRVRIGRNGGCPSQGGQSGAFCTLMRRSRSRVRWRGWSG